MGPGAMRINDIPAIEANGLEKRFGTVDALRGVSFRAARGSVLGVLGPNGAGKTTTVSILSTLQQPTAGYAAICGYDVVDDADRVRELIMLTGQFAALDGMLTGRENLIFFGRLMGLPRTESRLRADELLAQFDLEDAADRRVDSYSGGMRRRIDIACGLVSPPEVVFLDEPTTGLDPVSRQGVWNLVRSFRDSGITTLLTTQYLEEADVLCDEIVVIDNGRVVAEGTPDELKARTGESVCEVVPLLADQVHAAADALSDFAGVAVGSDGAKLSFPAPDGADTLARAVVVLAEHRIELADIGLRRPSLDEAFIQLTGRRDGDDQSSQAGQHQPRDRK